MNDATAAIIQSFGPIAFGVVALLVIWKWIVKPELDAARTNTAAVANLIASLTALTGEVRQIQNTQTAQMNLMQSLLNDTQELADRVRECRDGCPETNHAPKRHRT